MSKQEAGLMTVRLSEALRQEFMQSAAFNEESPSQALRNAIQKYVSETRKLALQREAEAIRANAADEEDAMKWIAAHGLLDDQD